MCIRWCGLILASFALLPAHTPRKARRHAPVSSTLAVTTSSPQARKQFEAGMADFENYHADRALQNLQSATRKDPKFALAWLFTSEASEDVNEQKAARLKAVALTRRVTPGEKLMINWLIAAQQGEYVPAIAAMNDLLARYPADKRVALLAGRWLAEQGQYGPAAAHLHRAIGLDQNYAAAWNELAYCYAHNGDYSEAFAAMERYVALLPNDPNPQDSYAEILRMAGNFRGALDHYQLALKIDPQFQSAQLGVADTYALMGEEATARHQYEKAILKAANTAEKMQYELQSAITYVREKKRGKATSALNTVAKEAHEGGLHLQEAEALRTLVLNERDNRESLLYLDRADAALANAKVSRTQLDEEQAQLLRLRAVRSQSAGLPLAAAKALQQMQALADSTHQDALRRVFAGTMGSVLVIQQKYGEAIPYLEEEPANPLCVQDLIAAYNRTGANDRAHALELTLATLNQPTIEQALVVPELRARLAASSEKHGWLRKLLPVSQ